MVELRNMNNGHHIVGGEVRTTSNARACFDRGGWQSAGTVCSVVMKNPFPEYVQ